MRRKLERRRIEDARTVIMVRAFWLLRGGGQGRGRTADLPLFREPIYHVLTRQNAARRPNMGTYWA